jgi:hypothetical protein
LVGSSKRAFTGSTKVSTFHTTKPTKYSAAVLLILDAAGATVRIAFETDDALVLMRRCPGVAPA